MEKFLPGFSVESCFIGATIASVVFTPALLYIAHKYRRARGMVELLHQVRKNGSGASPTGKS